MKKGLVILMCLLAAAASRATIMKEYDDIQEKLDQPENQKEKQQAKLESTLTDNLRSALLRYYRMKDYDKVQTSEVKYEQAENNNLIYYIKYKEFVGKFRYKSDPKKFSTQPVETRLLIKPGAKVEELPDFFKNKDKKADSGQKTSGGQNNS